MFDEWNSAIWWVVFGRRRFGGSMLVYLNGFALEFVVCLTFRTTHGYVTWHGDFFQSSTHVAMLKVFAQLQQTLRDYRHYLFLAFWKCWDFPWSCNVPHFRTMTIPANLLQHKLIDAPLLLKMWADLEVVVRLRHGRQVGFEFFVGRCCNPFLFKIQANYCRTSRNNMFSHPKKMGFVSERMEWQALNAQKARVTSAPVRNSLVSMCCFVVVCFFFPTDGICGGKPPSWLKKGGLKDSCNL